MSSYAVRKPVWFLHAYRVILPLVLFILLIVIPELRSETSDLIAAFLRWSMVLFLPAAYITVTYLDETPSKRSWWKGIWFRFGAFNGNRFLPYYDRSTVGVYYYYNAAAASIISSILLRGALFGTRIYAPAFCTIVAVGNGVFLLTPFLIFYPAFISAIYSSDATE